MKLEVTVKKKHWENGKRLSAYSCAVANALSSILGEVTVCSRIYYTDVGFHSDLRKYPSSEIPDYVIHQMIRFDAGHAFPGEFSFYVEVPEEVIDTINIDKIFNINHLKLVY